MECIIWRIESHDKTLADKVGNSYTKIASSAPKEYRFAFDPPDSFLPEENGAHFIIGRSLDEILGYAFCQEHSPARIIGEASMLDSLRRKALSDFNGQPVTRETLGDYDGYREYTGKGGVLYIELMEVFLYQQGLGRALVEHLQSQEYELIELEANGIQPVRFFQKCGFVDTGIDAEDGEQLVMVWNNPKYL